MKNLISGFLFLGLFVSISAWAGSSDDLPCMNNFDAKIKALDNYTVTFKEPGKSATKMTTAHNDDPAGIKIHLIHKKKKKA